MTVHIASACRNSESRSAEELVRALLKSAPELNHPDIDLRIFAGMLLPEAEIDLVLLFHDRRATAQLFRSSHGDIVHSFVMTIEVKRHSPDSIRFRGPRLEVRYDGRWHDASGQCAAQPFALKSFQRAATQWGKRETTYVQNALWLTNVPRRSLGETPADSSVKVHCAELTWNQLIDGLRRPTHFRHDQVRALADNPCGKIHDITSLAALLTHEVAPTRLDLKRINMLTQARFDSEKSAYIRNLGEGLLVLRGRGGTGKTFALLQIALHLAKTGRRCVILTFNHGLIADINRSLRFIAESEPALRPLPRLMTRYRYIQSVFERTFGSEAEKNIREVKDLEERECERQRALLQHSGDIDSGADFLLVDEGQDWSDEQRDLLFKLMTPGRVIVADGVDQFVDKFRCRWDLDHIPINRRHTLRASRRTKGATCLTIGEIAREAGITGWDLEPDPETFGGRVSVFVQPEARKAVDHGLTLLAAERQHMPSLRPVDDLVCLPSSRMAKGVNFPVLLERQLIPTSKHLWRGYDADDRRVYPLEQTQLRSVQYASCRGMEGWSVLCLGLDLFYDFHFERPQIEKAALEARLKEELGLYYVSKNLEEQYAADVRSFAANWLMIPLTRSIDHLVIHLTSAQSRLGRLLTAVSTRNPGAIEWLECSAPVRTAACN